MPHKLTILTIKMKS